MGNKNPEMPKFSLTTPPKMKERDDIRRSKQKCSFCENGCGKCNAGFVETMHIEPHQLFRLF